MADNSTPDSAAGNATANNDSAAGNAPESENNSQLLAADMLDKAVDKLDILVAKHFQEGASKLPDDARHQIAPDFPLYDAIQPDEAKGYLQAFDEFMAANPPARQRASVQELLDAHYRAMDDLRAMGDPSPERESDMLMARLALGAAASTKRYLDENTELISQLNDEVRERIMAAINHLQTYNSQVNEEMEEYLEQAKEK
jgi:hypothetical protein